MADEVFPTDSDGHPLAWPAPSGGYVDAWNGWYETREQALHEVQYWTAEDSTRTRRYGDDLADDDT